MVWTKTKPSPSSPAAKKPPESAAPEPPAPIAQAAPELPPAPAAVPAAPAVRKPELPAFFKRSPSALKAIVATIEAPATPLSPFPVVYQVSGPTGGALERERLRGEDPFADVPVPIGRQAFVAGLIAFRLRLLLWPTAANKSTEPVPPRVRAWIAFSDGSLANRVIEATKRYQMLKGDPEHLSAVYDPVGHPQIALELLCATDEAGLFVVRTAPTYASVSNTLVHLSKLYGEAEELAPEVVVITPSTTTVSSKTRQWKEHYLTLSPSPRNSETTQQTLKALMHYLNSQESPYDPQTIKAWIQPELAPEVVSAVENFLSVQ